jgi:diacylglycerol kinase (ATP)
LFRQVRAELSKSFDLSTEWPTSPLETTRESLRAANEGVDAVFAMGGDGVAHHVANSLVGSGTALGLIPAGTTNVLARILDIPLSSLKAARASAEFESLPTRMVRVDAETDIGFRRRYATFSLGVGFDADVVSIAESRPYAKVRFGGIHYARTAVGRLVSTWRTHQPHLRLTCDGDRFDGVVALTQVHHPYTYFGKFPLHLTNDRLDGVATLAACGLGIARSSYIFARAALGAKHREATGTRLWTDYESLIIEAEPSAPFHADGEFLGMANHLEIAPARDALLVLRPPIQSSSD